MVTGVQTCALPIYKVYLFPNAFTLGEEMRAKIKERVRRAGKTAIWIYAPGYFRNGRGDKSNVEELTGLALERRPAEDGACVSWTLEPSGDAVCAEDGWRSVFFPRPPSATALRQAFRAAGAHVWMETDDVFAAGRGYVMVHAASTGLKTVRLKASCNVREIFGAAQTRVGVTSITERMKLGETRVFRISATPNSSPR